MQSYIWFGDATGRAYLAAATAAARRGVVVRVIMDGVGGRGARSRAARRLTAAGGAIGVFNRLRFRPGHRRWYRRNHRKLVVVDGATGFIGGFGFWNESAPPPPAGRWDLGARVRGPVVPQFRRAFAHDWRLCGGEPLPALPGGTPACAGRETLRLLPSLAGRHLLLRRLNERLAVARARAWICTTYFIPSPLMRARLRGAARRGVDVRILLPTPRREALAFRFAGRRHYGSLLAAGVRIHEYLPTFLHSKYAVVDGWGCLGSSNLDNWSGRFNLEADLELLSARPRRALERRFREDCRAGREITRGRWERRARWIRAMERAFGWIDPLL